MPTSSLDRLRKICLALPQAREVVAWGEPTFRVRNKLFAMYASGSNHHGSGRNAVWCKATHIDQELLIRADANRFFSPPYVGPSGWVGIYLDGNPDWDLVAEQLRDAYRLIAPKKLLAELTLERAPRGAQKTPTHSGKKGQSQRGRRNRSARM